VAVEAGISQGWHKWIGTNGALVTLDHYGASAPAPKLMEEFGFTAEHVVEKVLAAIEKVSIR
jgi:transketolase